MNKEPIIQPPDLEFKETLMQVDPTLCKIIEVMPNLEGNCEAIIRHIQYCNLITGSDGSVSYKDNATFKKMLGKGTVSINQPSKLQNPFW